MYKITKLCNCVHCSHNHDIMYMVTPKIMMPNQPAAPEVDNLCLRWRNNYWNMIQALRESLKCEQFVDVTLVCTYPENRGNPDGRLSSTPEPQISTLSNTCGIKAHRVVLSASSLFFKRILEDAPNQYPYVVVLSGFDPRDLDYILDFAYMGEVMVPKCHLASVLHAANQLQIKGLCNDTYFKNQSSCFNGGDDETCSRIGKAQRDRIQNQLALQNTVMRQINADSELDGSSSVAVSCVAKLSKRKTPPRFHFPQAKKYFCGGETIDNDAHDNCLTREEKHMHEKLCKEDEVSDVIKDKSVQDDDYYRLHSDVTVVALVDSECPTEHIVETSTSISDNFRVAEDDGVDSVREERTEEMKVPLSAFVSSLEEVEGQARGGRSYTKRDMVLALQALKDRKMSLTKASEAYGIPATTLWQRANRLGIATPKKECSSKTWSEEKLKSALEALRNKEISANKAAKVYGIPSSTLYKIARKEGIELAQPFNAVATAWSRDDLDRALEAIRNGMPVQRAANQHGIPTGTLYGRCKKVGIELSKATSVHWSEDSMRLALLSVRSGKMSINQAAIQHNLPYSSLYGRVNRLKKDDESTTIDDVERDDENVNDGVISEPDLFAPSFSYPPPQLLQSLPKLSVASNFSDDIRYQPSMNDFVMPFLVGAHRHIDNLPTSLKLMPHLTPMPIVRQDK